MKKKTMRSFGFLSILVVGVLSVHAREYQGLAQVKVPHLGNHRFVTNPTVRDPFIQTHFRNTLGVGEAFDMKMPILTVGDETLWGFRGNLMFVKLDFEYQYAFKKWMAIFINFDIYGRLGSGVQSLLAQGMTASVNTEFGWMFRLYQSERILLSATANLWNSSGTIVNLYDFLTGIIEEDGLTPENHLVRRRPYLRGGGGLRYAWATSDLIGMNAIAELGYGESVDRRMENRLYHRLGVSADLDINRTKFHVPIGLAFGVAYDSFISGNDNTVAGDLVTLLLRIAYTGRPDFILSLDVMGSRLPLKQLNQDVNMVVSTINMKYFF